MDSKTVGQYIREKRLEKNLTQNELGELLYVSDKTISRWETDVTLPDASILPKLADTFGVTTDEILSAGVKGDQYHKDQYKLRKYKYIMVIALLLVIITGYTPWGVYTGGGDQTFFWDNTDYQPYVTAFLLSYGVFTIMHKKGDRILYFLELLCLAGFCGCYCHLLNTLQNISWYRVYPNATGAVFVNALAAVLHAVLFYKQSFAKPDTELWTGKRMRHLLALITAVYSIFIFYPYENGFGCVFIFAFVYPDSRTWGNVPADSYRGLILTLGWVSVVVNFLLSEAFDNWKKGFWIGYFLTNVHIIVSAVSAIFRFNYHSPRIWIVVGLNILQVVVTLLFMRKLDPDNTLNKFQLSKKTKTISIIAVLIVIMSFGYYIVGSYGIYAKSDIIVAEYSGTANMSLYEGSEAWEFGQNQYGEPVFRDPRKAFDHARYKFSKVIEYIYRTEKEHDQYIHAFDYNHFQYYKVFAWQVQTDDEEIRRQGVELTKFLDIYENSLKKWLWVWGMGFQRIVPAEKEGR